MFNALLNKQARRGFGAANGRIESIPAPVGGWNRRDALSAMKPEDAVVLDNIIPDAGRVRLRPGYAAHATGATGNYIETLMEYSPPSGQNKLFAATPSRIYDATLAGAFTSALISGTTNGRWAHTMMTGAAGAGNFLCMVNGADHYETYNGTAWVDQHAALTGVDSTTLINISVHANRLWLVQKDSLDAWYLPVSSITGAAVKLPLGPLCKKGGYLVAISTWTKDAGDGMDDLWVGVTSKGQVIVYSGTDPAAASTWQLVGVFEIGEPVGRRCMIKVGGDLGIITSRGVALLSQLMAVNRSGQEKVTITNKISGAFADAYNAAASTFGWQIVEFPKQNLVIVNVPMTERELAYQYVINVATGAWCRFTGINAGCWSLLGDDLFFGGHNGTVYKFGEELSDNGSEINWAIQTAFNRLRSPQSKTVHMVRPLIMATPGYVPGVQIMVDYDNGPITVQARTFGSVGSLWDVAEWDVAGWGATSAKSARWKTVNATGVAFSVAIVGTAADVVFEFNSVDVLFEPGGYL